MKYLLLIYFDDAWDKLPLTERQEIYRGQTQVADELRASGRYLGGHPLHPPSTATSVRVRDGRRLLTDGPFAETREQLGGYFIIDVGDLDEAIDIAGRLPSASLGTVEIRPIMEIPGLPSQ